MQLAQLLPMEENFLLLFRFDNPLESSVEFMKVSHSLVTVRSQVQEGMLINILTLRSQLHDGASFGTLLCVVKFKKAIHNINSAQSTSWWCVIH